MVFFISFFDSSRAEDGNLGDLPQIKAYEDATDPIVKKLFFNLIYFRVQINVSDQFLEALFVDMDVHPQLLCIATSFS